MSTETNDLSMALARLREGADGGTWQARQRAGEAAVAALQERRDTEVASEIMLLLAEDPKWEVRRFVARELAMMPPPHFTEVARRLASDPNYYVKRVAQQALKEQQASARERLRRAMQEEELQEQFGQIAEWVEPRLAKKITGLCRRHCDQVIRSVLHDLRGVLTSHLVTCQQLLSKPALADDAIVAQGRKQIGMLENTLESIELYTRAVTEERRDETVHRLCFDACHLVDEWTRRKYGHIESVRLDMDGVLLTPVRVSRHAMVMALANVIDNAVDALATGGRVPSGSIHVHVAADAAYVTIRISDTGIGMSPERLARVRRFRPGDRNPDKVASSGYGLPIAARNVTWHDGTLSIESQPNAGTTVTIRLPVSHYEEYRDDDTRAGRRG